MFKRKISKALTLFFSAGLIGSTVSSGLAEDFQLKTSQTKNIVYSEEAQLDAKIEELRALLREYDAKKAEIKQLLKILEDKEKKLMAKEKDIEAIDKEIEKTKKEISEKNKDLEDIIKKLKGLKINGLWYISYQNWTQNGPDYKSKIAIKRGYVRFTKSITPWFDAHVTFDVTQANEDTGNLDGSIVVRTKYIFGKFKFPDIGFLTKPTLEFGQVHFPWLDFEEHVNFFRCQDTMFTERNHIYNSADFGATFMALLGGEMPEWYKKHVNSHYPGRYGSIALGIYNGAGYHGREKNNNKPIEARITIRPLPEILPGFQISYFGIRGKGNKADNPPDWKVNLLFASYEHEYFTTTAQYYWGKGNLNGDDNYDKDGYSLFLELKPYAFSSLPISIIGRYDYFDPNDDQDNDESKRYIVGLAYHFDKPHKNMVLLDYDHLNQDNKDDESRVQLTLQIKF